MGRLMLEMQHVSKRFSGSLAVDNVSFRVSTGEGQGYYAGLGGTGEVPAGRFVLLPTARVRVGRVVSSGDVRTGMRGVELGMGLRRTL